MSALHQLSPKSESRSGSLASISVVRYLDAAGLGVVPERHRPQWKWITSALITGALFGFGLNFCFDVNAAAVPEHLARVNFQSTSQTVVSVPYSHDSSSSSTLLARSKRPASASELEEIRTRNRRLEALVKVLRQRTVEKRPNAVGSRPG